MNSVLVVDDDEQMRKALYAALKRKGYKVECASSGDEALWKLGKETYNALVSDIKMPGISGIELLKEVKRINPSIPVLMMTAYGTIETAIEAMKIGASDYILKPFSTEIIEAALSRALSPDLLPESVSGIIARSEKMRSLLEIAKNVAPTSATVLITGESGTGKELLAMYLHTLSERPSGPFVSVNCASIPDGLLESELFGHEKGAFTGATARRTGKFELADGGTLLLDEIGEMGLELQAKLLRVLQQREIDRVGGRNPVPVDIRVIATTNRELYKEVSEGRFREDLFYRLNVFPFKLPALRERPEDIEILAEHYLKLYSVQYNKKIQSIGPEAMDSLIVNPWKGNIRELANVIERAVLLCSNGELTVSDLYYGDEMSTPSSTKSVKPPAENSVRGFRTIREMEKELILKTVSEANGNRMEAAERLGISVRTLRNKLNEYNTEVKNSA